MTIFRKAVLERKQKNIDGVLLADYSKRQMRAILLLMLTTVVALSFLCQKKIKVYTAVKNIISFKGYEKKETCFAFEFLSSRKVNIETGELIRISLNNEEGLTGTVSRIIDDNRICIKTEKEAKKNLPPSVPGTSVYLQKNEKLWIFIYKKIEGSTLT